MPGQTRAGTATAAEDGGRSLHFGLRGGATWPKIDAPLSRPIAGKYVIPVTKTSLESTTLWGLSEGMRGFRPELIPWGSPGTRPKPESGFTAGPVRSLPLVATRGLFDTGVPRRPRMVPCPADSTSTTLLISGLERRMRLAFAPDGLPAAIANLPVDGCTRGWRGPDEMYRGPFHTRMSRETRRKQGDARSHIGIRASHFRVSERGSSRPK